MWNDLIQGKEFCIDGVERKPLGLTEHDGSRAQSCLSTFTAGSLHSGLRKNFDMRFCSQLKQGGGKNVLMMQWYQALDLVWRELSRIWKPTVICLPNQVGKQFVHPCVWIVWGFSAVLRVACEETFPKLWGSGSSGKLKRERQDCKGSSGCCSLHLELSPEAPFHRAELWSHF